MDLPSSGTELSICSTSDGNPQVVGQLEAGSGAGAVSPHFFTCGAPAETLVLGTLAPALLGAGGGLAELLLLDKTGVVNVLGQQQMTIVSSDGTVYSPTDGASFNAALGAMGAAGTTVVDMTIKGHGSPETVQIGANGEILVVAGNSIIISEVANLNNSIDVTVAFNAVVNANSDIDIRACNTAELAEALDGALGGAPTVSGAPIPVLGIPFTDWTIGPWYNY